MMISVGDVRLFVDIDGAKLVPDGDSMRERPTIVLLHGGPGGDHTPYKENYAPLREIAQVVYYDHRANGRSEDGAKELWTLAQWTADLRALCEVLGIDAPILFGVSFGGLVALNYAIEYPDHPDRIVVSCAGARVDAERTFAMYERFGGAEARLIAERFYTDPSPENRDEYLRVCGPLFTHAPRRADVVARITARPDVLAHYVRGQFLRVDLTLKLDRISCPVLLLAGELDPIVTLQDVEDLAAALPADRVELVRFPDAGHGLIGQHDAVLEHLREFVLRDSATDER